MYYYTKFEKIDQMQNFALVFAAAENTLDKIRFPTV